MNIWWLATAQNDGYCSYNELKYRKVLAQGWSQIGDLRALLPLQNEEKFQETIRALVKYVYNDLEPADKPAYTILNLLKMQQNDLVLCTEGTTVKGIAKITSEPQYRYDDGGGSYEYAQTIFPVTDWVDWDESVVAPPSTSTRGPAGIQQFQGDKQAILDAYEKLILNRK
ncbi:MAG: hypothetical protein BWY02_02136 [bacterium ADurb.Bin157]|nr:MAG: hypothetical protein BWY02_02136 [bacterium ADurb.Bin157]